MLYNSDLLKIHPNAKGINGQELIPTGTLNPCGLISANYFNDNFNLKKFSDSQAELSNILINRTAITYEIDRNYFQRIPDDQNELQWVDVEDENFIGWMYMETFSNFIKKWGKINTNLGEGEYKLTVENLWESSNFDTEKHFVILSGVENTFKPFFGYTLIVCAQIFLIAIFILVITRSKQKKIFNTNDLKWE
jgi:hypothetical protein